MLDRSDNQLHHRTRLNGKIFSKSNHEEIAKSSPHSIDPWCSRSVPGPEALDSSEAFSAVELMHHEAIPW
jgi:hypothetical protein